MSTNTLEKTTLLDIDKLNLELREAHRLLNVHGMGHYWTPNIDTFSNALGMLKRKVGQ